MFTLLFTLLNTTAHSAVDYEKELQLFLNDPIVASYPDDGSYPEWGSYPGWGSYPNDTVQLQDPAYRGTLFLGNTAQELSHAQGKLPGFIKEGFKKYAAAKLNHRANQACKLLGFGRARFVDTETVTARKLVVISATGVGHIEDFESVSGSQPSAITVLHCSSRKASK